MNIYRNLLEEIWKPIEGYNNYYISNHGNIMSFKRYKNGRILKQISCTNGYLKIILYNNGKQENISIHRLVAKAFINNSNPDIFNEVNHIDENKQNNHYLNLEWCTQQYNVEYSQSKKYKIIFPNGNIQTVFNLNKFCKENNLDSSNLNQTLKTGYYHKGHKIIDIFK
jgi:hypothetical protein